MTTEPCIDLAASHITLRLNGFTITGSADPELASAIRRQAIRKPTASALINVTHVRIVGPGMIQKFRRHGIFIVGQPGVLTRGLRSATLRRITTVSVASSQI